MLNATIGRSSLVLFRGKTELFTTHIVPMEVDSTKNNCTYKQSYLSLSFRTLVANV